MENQINSGGSSDLSWLPYGAYDKLLANARRKTQRVLNNELLEARLRQWRGLYKSNRVAPELDKAPRFNT
jgi:hypothetical protein